MADEQNVIQPKASQAPAAPAQSTAEAQPAMPEAPEENPLDRIGSGNPMARQVKNQLLGIERMRARSDEAGAVSEQTVDRLREVVIDEFQQFLEGNGIDVANPEAIKAFIEALRETNPDMVPLIETVFRTLMKEEKGVNVGSLSAGRDLKRKFNERPEAMPEGEMPEGEMPEGEMPEGEMPEGEMPEGEMPEGEEAMPEGMPLM